MAELAAAWGDLNLYGLPDGGYLWGREFQVLPSGTMADSSQILHGLIGVTAEPIGGKKCRYLPDARLRIYGTRGTDTEALEGYQDELADLFNAQRETREA